MAMFSVVVEALLCVTLTATAIWAAPADLTTEGSSLYWKFCLQSLNVIHPTLHSCRFGLLVPRDWSSDLLNSTLEDFLKSISH